jgi:Rieske 2Fe-2S family protein
VQRGLASPHFKPGPFAPAEDAVHAFVGMVGRGYRGLPLG